MKNRPFKNSFIVALWLCLVPVLHAQNPDIDLLRRINQPGAQASDPYFSFLSDSHIYIAAGVPLGLGLAGWLSGNDDLLWDAFETGSALVVCEAIVYPLKHLVNRERPYITYPDIVKKSDGGSPSFPSGHTSVCFATATSLSLLYPEWYVVVPSYLWAASVGYSRMHLGVHYPSDVLAGALIGTGSAFLNHRLNQWVQTKYRPKHGKFE